MCLLLILIFLASFAAGFGSEEISECGRITILSIYLLFAIIQFGLVLKAVGQIDSDITSYKYKYKELKDEYKLKYE